MAIFDRPEGSQVMTLAWDLAAAACGPRSGIIPAVQFDDAYVPEASPEQMSVWWDPDKDEHPVHELVRLAAESGSPAEISLRLTTYLPGAAPPLEPPPQDWVEVSALLRWGMPISELAANPLLHTWKATTVSYLRADKVLCTAVVDCLLSPPELRALRERLSLGGGKLVGHRWEPRTPSVTVPAEELLAHLGVMEHCVALGLDPTSGHNVLALLSEFEQEEPPLEALANCLVEWTWKGHQASSVRAIRGAQAEVMEWLESALGDRCAFEFLGTDDGRGDTARVPSLAELQERLAARPGEDPYVWERKRESTDG